MIISTHVPRILKRLPRKVICLGQFIPPGQAKNAIKKWEMF